MMSVDDVTKLDGDADIRKIGELTYRHDVSVAAYHGGRILLVKMGGYDHRSHGWRLPQGSVAAFRSVDAEIDPQDVSPDKKVVMKLLKSLVGCVRVGEVRRADQYRLDYDENVRQASAPNVTGNIFDGKVIDLYLAEMLCEEKNLVRGRRVTEMKMVLPADVDKHNLAIQEFVALNTLLKRYCIDC